jgi:putative mRNA 3-end processing factor
MNVSPSLDRPPLVTVTPDGLYCPPGGFHIDPWRPVARALITHAHGDHARWGSQHYLGTRPSLGLLRKRLGPEANISTLDYGERQSLGEVTVSFHPAGHVLGSAQIRIEHRGEVWVVSGDYKRDPDPTCDPFEPVRCDTFITEATFGLPIYRWEDTPLIAEEVLRWWDGNRTLGRASVLFCYALGKAQRLLAGLDPSIGPIYTHGAVERLNEDYRRMGIPLPETRYAGAEPRGTNWGGTMVVAPPSAMGTPWMRRFGATSTAFASGWMRVRGQRRRRSVDRGFVLSDHVDWPSLLGAIKETGAECVWVTHGYREPVVRWLRERGWQAQAIASRWEGESDEADVLPEATEADEPTPGADLSS